MQEKTPIVSFEKKEQLNQKFIGKREFVEKFEIVSIRHTILPLLRTSKLPSSQKLSTHSLFERFRFRVGVERAWRWDKGERHTGGVVRHHPRHAERERQRNRKWSIKRSKQTGLRHSLHGIAAAHLRRGHLENMAGKRSVR